MTVGIDISAIQYNRGVSRYTSNLVRALSHRKDVTLKLFGSSLRQRGVLQTFAKSCPSASATILPHPVTILNILWNELHVLPIESVMGRMDVFHSWEIQPLVHSTALVSTIHDLAMLRYPETADPRVLAMNRLSWKHLKKDAKAIIAVSQATKKDIVQYLKIDPEKIHVVYEALPAESKITLPANKRQQILKKLGVIKPYIFFIGTLEPRKNLPNLIAAWRSLKQEVDLVLAGAPGWETFQPEEGLHLLGVVDNMQLAALYAGSQAFVYPSLYEGFGLPILEAFYHHTPVVTSNTSSMPEVAGNAAVYVQPNSVESIKKGIEQALRLRKTLIQKGSKRLKHFTWEKTAEQTVDVYKKAIGQ